MKNLLFLFFITLLTFSSCEKDELVEDVPVEEPVAETIPLAGDWLLVDGTMYLTNIETNEKTRYSHFGPGKTVSSLRLEGSLYEIEELKQNETVWSFRNAKESGGYGQFFIDYDSIQPYGLNISQNYWTIIESPTATASTTQMDGSARPFTAIIDDYASKTIIIDIQMAYTSFGGYNYQYQSKLKFRKL